MNYLRKQESEAKINGRGPANLFTMDYRVIQENGQNGSSK